MRAFLKKLRKRLERRRRIAAACQASSGRLFRSPLAFRVLEPRRVLSVSGTFTGGILDISVTDSGTPGDVTDANLLADGTDFFVDANDNLLFDIGESNGRIADLRQVLVSGGAGQVGNFLWRGDFSSAPLDNVNASGDVISISNVQKISFDASLETAGGVSVIGQQDLSFNGSLNVAGDAVFESVNGTITDGSNSSIQVSGSATFLAESDVVLADTVDSEVSVGIAKIASQSGDIRMGQVGSVIIGGYIEAEGRDITIVEDADTTLNTISATSEIDVTSSGALTVNEAINSTGGNINLNAGQNVTVNADVRVAGDVAGPGTDGSITITAVNGDILINSGTISTVDGGTIGAGGDITLNATAADRVVTIGDGEQGGNATIQTVHGVVDINASRLNLDDFTPIQTDGKTTDRADGGSVDLRGTTDVVVQLEPTGFLLNSARTVTIDTDSGDDGRGGDILFAADGQIFASELGGQPRNRVLALDARGNTNGGTVNLVSTVADNGGSANGDFLAAFVARTNGTGQIDLDRDVTVSATNNDQSNGMQPATAGGITLEGHVEIDNTSGGTVPRTLRTSNQFGGDAGDVDLSRATLFGENAGIDLTIDVRSTGPSNAGDVFLGTFGNGGSGQFLQQLQVFSTNSTMNPANRGVMVLNGDVLLDDAGAGNPSSFKFTGASVMLSSSVTIDTEQENTAGVNGGLVNFGTASISADAADFDLSIDTTGEDNVTAGAITFGNVDNTTTRQLGTNATNAGVGGFFLNDLTLDARQASGTDGVITVNSDSAATTSIRTDGTGDVDIAGHWQLVGSTTLDTTNGGAAGGDVTVSGSVNSISAGTNNLTINAGTTGNATFGGAIGFGVNQELGAFTITNASDVDFQSTIEAARLTQSAGAGTTTLNNGTIGGAVDVTTAGIRLNSGTLVVAGAVGLTAQSGDINFISGAIEATGQAVTLDSAGTILDGTAAAEITSLSAILNSVSGIGSSAANGDLNTAVSRLDVTNTTSGGVFITNAGALELIDLDGDAAATLDGNFAGGGIITATSPLTISSNMTFAGSMTFVAGDNNAANDDDLAVNATVSLDSASDATFLFQAGDDVILNANGLITTAGAAHTIQIIADHEGATATDTDRGGVTQTSTSDVTISRTTGTATLIIDSSEGVGTTASALRTTIDTLDVDNTDSGDIVIIESDAVTVNQLDQDGGGAVSLTASGTLNVASGQAGVSATTGQITLNSTVADIVMQDGSTISSTAGDAVLIAANSISLSQVNLDSDGMNAAGKFIAAADVSLTNPSAGVGAIVDNNSGVTVDVEDANVIAAQALFFAADGVGVTDDINTVTAPGATALTIAALSDGGDINISHTGALVVGQVGGPSIVGGATGVTIADGAATEDVTLIASGDLSVDQSVGNDGGGDVNLLSEANVDLNASVQLDSTGDVNVVAGWDGSTGLTGTAFDIAALQRLLVGDLETQQLFGRNDGSIRIGSGTQVDGIAIGSRDGTTTVLTHDLLLNGSNTDEGFAQLGLRLPGDSGSIAGSINASAAGEIVLMAGTGQLSYVQIGHDGADLAVVAGGDDANVVDADITLAAAGSLSLDAGGNHSYAQVGHGGRSLTADFSGEVTIERAADIRLQGGTGASAYAQIGHGGIGTDSRNAITGDISVQQARDVSILAGSANGSHALIGHFAVQNSQSGDIDLAQVSTLTIVGADANDAFAKIGHGDAAGDSTAGNRSGDIQIEVLGETSLVDGLFSGSPSIFRAALIGHRTNGGTLWNADVTLTTATLDYDAIASSATGTIIQLLADRMETNLSGGNVEVNVTGPNGNDGNLINDGTWDYTSAHRLTLTSTGAATLNGSVFNRGPGSISVETGAADTVTIATDQYVRGQNLFLMTSAIVGDGQVILDLGDDDEADDILLFFEAATTDVVVTNTVAATTTEHFRSTGVVEVDLVVNGEDDQDSTLTVDFDNLSFAAGNPVELQEVIFNGGVASGNDALVLQDGGTLDTVTHDFTNETEGSVSLTRLDTSTANFLLGYTELDPIADNLDALNRVFNFNFAGGPDPGSETITLTDVADVGGFDLMQIDSDVGSETTTFRIPTSSLEMNAGAGADTMIVNPFDADFDSATTVTINGDAGADELILDFGAGDSVGVDGLTVTYVGGAPTTSTGDSVILRNGSAETVTFAPTSGSAGSVEVEGAAATTTLDYSEIEDGVTDLLAAATRVFDYAAGDDDIVIEDATDVGRMQITAASQTIEFAVPTVEFRVDAGRGNDSINFLSADAAWNAAVTLDDGQDDSGDFIEMNADLTLGSAVAGNTGNVTVSAFAFELAGSIDTTAATTNAGVGDIAVDAIQSVQLSSGSSITTAGGAVTLDGNQGTEASSGDFAGVTLSNAAVTSADGDIAIRGRGGDAAADQHGVQMIAGTMIESTGAAEVLITGTAGTADAAGILIAGATGNPTSIVSDSSLMQFKSVAGDVVLADELSSLLSANGDIVIDSAAGVVLNGALTAMNGSIGINATGSVSQNASGAVAAGSLGVVSTNGLIDLDRAANDVDVFAASAPNGIALNNVDDVTIESVAAIGCFTGVSDLTTTANGPIKLVTLAGNIVLSDGFDGDGLSVSASGSGDVLIEGRSGSSIIVSNDAAIRSGTGHVTLTADNDVWQNSDISTGGTGTIFVSAENTILDGVSNDGVIMGASARTTTAGGNVFLQANQESDLRLSSVEAGTGDVRLSAQRDIIDVNGASINITADRLIAVADSDGNGSGQIGSVTAGNSVVAANARSLDTDVHILTAKSATGIFIQETDSLTISQVDFAGVKQANLNGSVETVAPLTMGGLATTHVGDILVDVQGGLSINEAISAGTADVRLIVEGNLTQDSNGIITANEFGIRQESTTGDVELGIANQVDEFAGFNADPNGTIEFRTTRDLTIVEIDSQSNDDTFFGAVNGISSNTLDLTSGGEITNATNVTVNITGEATIDADNNSITLGTENGDLIQFGSLNVTGSAVEIEEDSGTQLSGVRATSLDLTSQGDITDIAGVAIQADGRTRLEGTNITLADQNNDSLRLLGDVRFVATIGDVTIARPGSVELGTIRLAIGENIILNENTEMLLDTVIADQELTSFSETSIRNLVAANVATGTGLIAPIANLTSDGFVHLAETHFSQISGSAGASASVTADPRLDLNAVANAQGLVVLDALNQNIEPGVPVSPNFISGETLDQVASNFSFIEFQGGRYGLYLTNQTSLEVDEYVGNGDAVNLYIETSDGQDLTIANRVVIENQSFDHGSMTLIAGNDLVLNGSLETFDASMDPADAQRVLQTQMITDAFDANEGPAGFESTRSVLLASAAAVDTKDSAVQSGAQNVLQRVSTQLGIADEAGFLTIVRYADGLSQLFDTFSEADASIQNGIGVKGDSAVFDGVIPAHAVGSSDAIVFEREIPFNSSFLNTYAKLPTTLVARRSTDFFLFEDGGRTDLSTTSFDLNSATDQIAGVLSNAVPPTFSMPTEIMVGEAFVLQANLISDTNINTTTLLPTTDEIPVQFQKIKEVAVFAVGFDDENENGQPEDSEIPTRRLILETEPLADPPDGDSPPMQSADLPAGQRALSSRDVLGTDTLTPNDVEAVIEEYRSDPMRPAGVYVIVESDPESGENVLRIFTVRDFDSAETSDASVVFPDPNRENNGENEENPLRPDGEEFSDPKTNHEANPAGGLPVIESGFGTAFIMTSGRRQKRKRQERLHRSSSAVVGEQKMEQSFDRRRRRWRRIDPSHAPTMNDGEIPNDCGGDVL